MNKEQIVALDSIFRGLEMSPGWTEGLLPFLNTRYEALKDALAAGVDQEHYWRLVGEADAYKKVVAEVQKRARRKSSDVTNPA